MVNLGPKPLEDGSIFPSHHGFESVVQISENVQNLVPDDLTNNQSLPVDDLIPKSFLGLDFEEQFSLDALKPMNLDGPYFKENFIFLRFKDLKSHEPLLEVQSEDSRLTVPSLGGLGFVFPIKDYKDKGYYLISCAKTGRSSILNKVQPVFLWMQTIGHLSVHLRRILMFNWNTILGHLEQ